MRDEFEITVMQINIPDMSVEEEFFIQFGWIFLWEFMGYRKLCNGDVLSESPLIWEPLP